MSVVSPFGDVTSPPPRPPPGRTQAYQSKANWPLANFNPAWHLATYVRTNCVWDDVDAGTCFAAPDGGAFTAGSSAGVTLQIMMSDTVPAAAADAPALAIHYTTDGSAPTPASPVYTPGAPIKLAAAAGGDGRVVITAMAWLDGVPTGQTTTTTWVAR